MKTKVCELCQIEKPNRECNKYLCKECCKIYKKCIDCGEIRLLSEFQKNGKSSRCNTTCYTKRQNEFRIKDNLIRENNKLCLGCTVIKKVKDFNKRRTLCKICTKLYKICTECNKVLDRNNFLDYWSKCHKCFEIYCKNNREKNIDNIKEVQKLYNINNKEKIRAKARVKEREKRKNNPTFALKKDVSRMVLTAFNKTNSTKNSSFWKAIGYTKEELRQYIDNLMDKSWMTWENRGNYNPITWNDNDPSTWKWQLDHIIPQYKLQFTSFEDENFKICWSLENLRPYSAKQNHYDGVNKVR